jgi:hypothetical protein
VLGLDGHEFSPALLYKIVLAGGLFKSFAQAGRALRDVADIPICDRQVERIAQEIGAELAQGRDDKAQKRRRRRLGAAVANAPEVVAVEVDGGKLATRASGCGPGVHEHGWREHKVACLARLQSDTHEADPQPDPPACFADPDYVAGLVRQVRAQAGAAAEQPPEPEEAAGAAAPAAEGPPAPPVPVRLVRTCVATLRDSKAFGPMVAAEAQERDFYAAGRRAFLADGQHYNWSIHRTYFKDFEPITDFIHVIDYVHAAAFAVGPDPPGRWSLYLGWMTACWQGRVAEVIEALRGWQARLGEAPEGAGVGEQDPRQVVARVLTYLGNNAPRMDYPRYRRLGLPVTSSLVESLIGEFNYRVKGKDKYWDRPDGAEAILQVRAALLSEDDRLRRHVLGRPGNPYRRRKPAQRRAREVG